MLLSLTLVGCASAPPTQITTNPISPVHVNCFYSAQMSAELEGIIANPANMSDRWEPSFSKLSGSTTIQQRVASAKTVLWSIRTRCPGS